jgi:hypothetical protein
MATKIESSFKCRECGHSVEGFEVPTDSPYLEWVGKEPFLTSGDNPLVNAKLIHYCFRGEDATLIAVADFAGILIRET